MSLKMTTPTPLGSPSLSPAPVSASQSTGTPDELEINVALYLHHKWHKSKKTYVCTSDVELAQDIVARVKEFMNEDHRHS